MENKRQPIDRINKKLHNTDLNEVSIRTSYKNYHEKSVSRSEHNEQELNDNISDKANSVNTSYQYRKKKNDQNSVYSKGSFNNQNPNKQTDEDQSYSMSDNDNLICENCINTVLMEEKRKRDNLDKNYYNTDGIFDDLNRNNERKLIEERKRQRENNTNEAIQNLAKINANLSSKDKLIQQNENSRNPLNDGLPDYQYQRFKDNYEKKQKMINDNINKFYPNSANERPEIASYYNNYVNNNQNYNKNEDYDNNINNNKRRNIERGEYDPKDLNRQEYIKSLEDQIYQKNEMKKKEREEDRRREQKQYEDMQREMKKEEEERYMKQQKQKEELIRANQDLIDQKNRMKMKEMEEKLKYKDYFDKQNEEYQKELKRKELENQKKLDDIYNDNRNQYENKKRMKEQDYRNNNIGNENIGNEQLQDHHKKHERMGRCCRCHRIFPRRLLTINRYFYKENRK